MTDVPEKIWVKPDAKLPSGAWFGAGGWRDARYELTFNTEYIRADLAKPKVKPLVWKPPHDENSVMPEWRASGVTYETRYMIEKGGALIFGKYSLFVGGRRWSKEGFKTLKAAKAAANTINEKLILGALV